MDGISRLRQLIENGVQVMHGRVYDRLGITPVVELLCIFQDGAREYAYKEHGYTPSPDSPLYKEMLKILRREGIDIETLRIGSKINVDVHTLEMPDGEVYQFLLPSTQYLRPDFPRRPARRAI